MARAQQRLRRPVLAPASIVDLDAVLIAIVQYTSSAEDVLSVLSALPAHLISPPLAALLRLLLATATPSKLWPQPWVMNVCCNNLDRLSAAMPIINSVHILIEAPLRASSFGSPPLPAPSEEPFFSFLAAWVAKVGQLTCKINERSTNNDKVCRLIAQCTNLQRAEVHENPRVLEAVLMHRVAELTVHCDIDATAWTAPIARWLASGCAVRLTLYRFGVGDCTGLARAVATSPTLSHLALRESSAVRAGIVANGLTLRHVTHFEYFTLPGCHRFEAALALLNLGSLVKLVLGGRSAYTTDLSCLLPALPHLSALDELQLFDISMDARPATHQTWTVAPRVRYIKLHDVRFSVESRRAILEWAGRSDRLDILRWPNCAASDRNGSFVGDDLQRIIHAGVRTIHCDWQLDQRDIAALTKAIHGSHAPYNTTLRLACCMLSRRAENRLRQELATCTNVAIELVRQDTILSSPVQSND